MPQLSSYCLCPLQHRSLLLHWALAILLVLHLVGTVGAISLLYVWMQQTAEQNWSNFGWLVLLMLVPLLLSILVGVIAGYWNQTDFWTRKGYWDRSVPHSAKAISSDCPLGFQKDGSCLRAILQNVGLGIIITDSAGQLVIANSKALRLLGYSEAEFYHTRLSDYVYADDLASVQALYQDVLTNVQKTSQLEQRFLRQNGQMFWGYLTLSAIRDENDTLLYIFGIIEDISDRKSIKDALWRSQQQYQALVQSIDGIVWEYDLRSHQYSFVSHKSQEILGYPAEDWFNYPQLWEDCIHPDDRKWVIHLCMTNTQLKQDSKFEYRMITATGQVIWIQDIISVIVEDDQAVLLRGILVDITDRKQAEEALRESEERFRGAFDDAAVGMALVSLDGRFLKFNQAFCEIVGYSSAELRMQTVTTITHPDDSEIERYQLNQLLQGKTHSYHLEKRYFHKQGHPVWVLLNVSLIQDANHFPLYFVSQIQNISDRKLAEESLHSVSRRLQYLLTSSPAVIFSRQPEDYALTFISDNVSTILGYPAETILDHPTFWNCHIHPEDRDEIDTILVNLSQSTEGWYAHEFRFLCADGCYRWLRSEMKIFKTADNKLLDIVGYLVDISERKRVEDERKQSALELQLAKEAAEAASRAKSAFLANMSHEFRTPLNVILGFTQVMALDANLTAENQQNLQVIQRSGDHLLSLINNVLDLSKIEAGRISLNETSFDLLALLKAIEAMLRLRAELKHLQFVLDIESDVPRCIIADQGKLRQVLLNLLGNAIKFTPERGNVSLKVRVNQWEVMPEELCSQAIELYLHFAVEDTGVGIAPEDLHRIFDAFEQTQIGRIAPEGTGLGLTISQRLVSLMGGEITVRSLLGQGSTFVFAIPVPFFNPSQWKHGVDGLPADPEMWCSSLNPAASMRMLERNALSQLTIAHFAEMSASWRHEVHQAALRCDDDQLESLIKQIPETQSFLLSGLLALINSLQFEHIAELTQSE